MIVTPLNKVDFARKPSGSCLTCVRDLNKNDVHHEIRVLKSINLIALNAFYPTENRQRLEVNIVLNASVIELNMFKTLRSLLH